MSKVKMRHVLQTRVLIALVAMVWAFSGCKQKEDDPQPENSSVSTNAPTNIDFTSATFGGNVTKLGTGGVTDHGFVWGETADPDLSAAGKKSLGAKAETGAFTHDVTGLTVGKTYHVRAYVTDAQGTFFGQDQTFSTTNSPNIASFTPTQGGQNDTLTITGSNFSISTSDITLKVGTTNVTTIVSSTLSEIKMIVPSGVTEGANKITITVKAQEVTSTDDFTYLGGMWTQKKVFGGSPRIGSVTFSIGNKGYVGMGRTTDNVSSGVDDLWEYDPTTDTWTQKANYLGGKRTSAVSFVIQQTAFVGLGVDETNTGKKDFWQYDQGTNKWTQTADFASTSNTLGSETAFSIGSKGYAYRNAANEFWEIDLGVWKQKNNLPFTPLPRLMFVINDVAYVLANDLKLWKYNVVSDSWTSVSTYAGKTLDNKMYDVTANGKGYMFSGQSDSYVIWEYDPSNNSWAKKNSLGGQLPSQFPAYSEAFNVNNKIYVREGGFTRNSFWEFDPSK